MDLNSVRPFKGFLKYPARKNNDTLLKYFTAATPTSTL
jgi:hypothetical protein